MINVALLWARFRRRVGNDCAATSVVSDLEAGCQEPVDQWQGVRDVEPCPDLRNRLADGKYAISKPAPHLREPSAQCCGLFRIGPSFYRCRDVSRRAQPRSSRSPLLGFEQPNGRPRVSPIRISEITLVSSISIENIYGYSFPVILVLFHKVVRKNNDLLLLVAIPVFYNALASSQSIIGFASLLTLLPLQPKSPAGWVGAVAAAETLRHTACRKPSVFGRRFASDYQQESSGRSNPTVPVTQPEQFAPFSGSSL